MTKTLLASGYVYREENNEMKKRLHIHIILVKLLEVNMNREDVA